MSLSRVSSRLSRSLLAQCRSSVLLYAGRHHHQHHHFISAPSNQLHTTVDSQNKVVTCQISMLRHSALGRYVFQRSAFSSSASPHPSDKENAQSGESTAENNGAAAESNGDAKVPEQTETSRSEDTKTTDQKEESDLEQELAMEDLVKLITEKEELLKVKQKEIENMKDKVLRTYAEMENVMTRTRREADNTKKFAIQNFAKGLLDVADNLSRASSVVKDSFTKIDASKDTVGAVPLLKTLLEGVEMTEKQLAEVFKKYGVEKFDPSNEQFDPNRHNAVFQVPDASKPPGTVAVVLKVGYMLHDRILRPAEVGVTDAVDDKGTD